MLVKLCKTLTSRPSPTKLTIKYNQIYFLSLHKFVIWFFIEISLPIWSCLVSEKNSHIFEEKYATDILKQWHDRLDITNLAVLAIKSMLSGCSKWLTARQCQSVATVPLFASTATMYSMTECRSQQTSLRVWGKLATVARAAGAAGLLGANECSGLHLLISSFLEPQDILAALLNNSFFSTIWWNELKMPSTAHHAKMAIYPVCVQSVYALHKRF